MVWDLLVRNQQVSLVKQRFCLRRGAPAVSPGWTVDRRRKCAVQSNAAARRPPPTACKCANKNSAPIKRPSNIIHIPPQSSLYVAGSLELTIIIMISSSPVGSQRFARRGRPTGRLNSEANGRETSGRRILCVCVMITTIDTGLPSGERQMNEGPVGSVYNDNNNNNSGGDVVCLEVRDEPGFSRLPSPLRDPSQPASVRWPLK